MEYLFGGEGGSKCLSQLEAVLAMLGIEPLRSNNTSCEPFQKDTPMFQDPLRNICGKIDVWACSGSEE